MVLPAPEGTRSETHTPRKNAPRDFHRRYSLEEKLGQGCFGRVYACRSVCSGSEEDFAVKVTDLKEDQDEALCSSSSSSVSSFSPLTLLFLLPLLPLLPLLLLLRTR